MALKKFDVPNIDSTITEAKDEELRKQEIEAHSDLALQIRIFMKEVPYIINEIRDAASQMDAQKFSSAVSGNLQKSAIEMAKTFNANVKPMVNKMETASKLCHRPGTRRLHNPLFLDMAVRISRLGDFCKYSCGTFPRDKFTCLPDNFLLGGYSGSHHLSHPKIQMVLRSELI